MQRSTSQTASHLVKIGTLSTPGARLALLGMLVLYVFVSLRNLDTLPPIFEDEPWISSVAWKLAKHGILGSDVFAGFYGMEQHYYGFMPLYPILTAIVLRISGLGLFQVRLVSVLLGLLILLLTYRLGRRLFSTQVGLLAVAFLLIVRTTSSSTYDLSGIPFLDITRIHRYDPGVAVFGMAALHAYISASDKRRCCWYLLTGILAGLAGLMHIYGLFWLAALLLLAVIERVSLNHLLTIIFGFSLPWVPYIIYIFADIPDWRGQTQFYAGRFELLNPAWYWRNLSAEYQRYSLGLLPLNWDSMARIGTWAMLLAVPCSLAGLFGNSLKFKDPAARRLLVPSLLLPILFALFISVKYRHYMAALLPLIVLTAAWGCINLWKLTQGRLVFRVILSLIIAAVMVEGASCIAALDVAARETTPYPDYIAQVRARIPDSARVLGLQTYWIGLHDLDYRTWIVPIYQELDNYHPLPIEEALERIDPQVILIDPAMRTYFSHPPAGDDLPERILIWMEKSGYQLTTSVEDNTYGVMEVYTHDTP